MNTNATPYSCSFNFSDSAIFESLTPEEMDFIQKNTVEVNFHKGENICKQGTYVKHMMLITKGLAKIYMEDEKESLILKILPPVNLIGLAFINEENPIMFYSAKAYIDSTVELIEINAFRKVLAQNVAFANRIIRLMSEHTLINYGRFFCLTHKQTYGRMADVLLCLSERIYKKSEFKLELSRKELAELAGMSVESTARIITRFKNDKLIRLEGKKIVILDVEKLVAISRKG